ncbi:MAG: CDP-2,3-bis-(O-geranylgeranyl)-sn-glycerol synthase [archaeon]
MVTIIDFVTLVFAYAVPMYFANATPIVIHGKKPIDFGKKIGKKRIFGDGKTVLGTFSGIGGGIVAGIVLLFFYPTIEILVPNYFLFAVALSVGAILGDMLKSFIKRRAGIESGAHWLLFDQLDFVLGGLLLSLIVRVPELEVAAFLLIATIVIHLATNFAAFKMKLKKVPW